MNFPVSPTFQPRMGNLASTPKEHQRRREQHARRDMVVAQGTLALVLELQEQQRMRGGEVQEYQRHRGEHRKAPTERDDFR